MTIFLGDTAFPVNAKCTAEFELTPEHGMRPEVVSCSWISPGGVSPDNPAWPWSVGRVIAAFHSMLGLRK